LQQHDEGVAVVKHSDYQRIEAAIRYLEANAVEQPSLDDVAEHIGLSAFHFQRLFKRWAGVSPKRFLQYLTVESAKQLLRDSISVLDTSYEVGLSGPGRLHDLFVSVDAVTPGEFKREGSELELRYAYHATPFGDCLVAETSRGICHLGFVSEENRALALDGLQENWRQARLTADPQAGRTDMQQLFSPERKTRPDQVRIFLKGTNFQLKVWEALLKIPEGTAISYGDLAARVGHPGAHRAVGTAAGHNPVAYLIPCHRVLRSTGEVGGYRWGTARKKAMLGYEAVQR
jgi:AraC family transcriptional regulator of adaptative response/methylated-DNA-[protein]-cysteine methyltransferase